MSFAWGSYAGIFAVSFVLCFVSPKIRGAGKKPFFALTNAFAAVTLAMFLMKYELAISLFFTAVFWIAGYLLYGVLCLITRKKEERAPASQTARALQGAVIPSNVQKPAVSSPSAQNPAPATKNSVRLEHAKTVTEKLLTKNLSKADRTELEKLKNTLSVLEIKGSLTPDEAEILNENFNALLKLMAKYNV